MLSKIQKLLSGKLSFLKGKKLLLAVSGGLDSIVMVHLFHEMKLDIAIAHCNFQLRGLESFDDQKFVETFAEKNEIPIFVTQFDTATFAKDYKLSTQVAARELRYNWFYELLDTEKFDYILTAHHADDNLETFLINLSRGTGLEGLTGIPEQNERIIRPLLAFSREEIYDFALANAIQWREDSSNASDKYLRNKIRHDLIPVLKQLNPDFLTAFQKTQDYLQQAQVMVEDASIMIYQQVAQEKGEEIYFDLKKLQQLPNYNSYLYQWLREFGFSAWDDIYALTHGQSGKQVFSKEYRLLKDRDFLILSLIKPNDREEYFTIDKNQKQVKFPLNLTFTRADASTVPSAHCIFVDEDALQFPLILRKWKEGDLFFPLGMDGKSKKVSKLFKDEKLSLLEKENCWILCSNNQIVWIIGIRQDERFKIKTTTTNVLQIALL